eukprot:scaffold1944_cov241-Pinguiococcus_pyrenoidosus.AAC.31
MTYGHPPASAASSPSTTAASRMCECSCSLSFVTSVTCTPGSPCLLATYWSSASDKALSIFKAFTSAKELRFVTFLAYLSRRSMCSPSACHPKRQVGLSKTLRVGKSGAVTCRAFPSKVRVPRAFPSKVRVTGAIPMNSDTYSVALCIVSGFFRMRLRSMENSGDPEAS